MYKRIDARRSVRKLYTESLVKRGDISIEEAEDALDDFQARLQTALEETRVARAEPRRSSRRPPPPPIGVLPHVDTGVDRATLDAHLRDARRPRPRASRSTRSWPSSSRPATRCSTDGEVDWALGRGAGVRLAAARGHRHPPRPARTPAAARSRSATRCWSTTRPAPSARRSPTSTPSRASSGSTTRCCRSTPRSASSTATRSSHKDALVVLGGAVRRLRQRRADHHRPVPRGGRGQVGPDVGPRAAAAARLRGAGPRALARPASSGSSRSAPRTTCRSCNASTSAQYFHLLRRQMQRECASRS